MHNILVYTDGDLDGAQSALILKWLFPTHNMTVKEIVSLQQWDSEISNCDLSQYHKVFILDKHVPDHLVEHVDKPNVVIIDHHLSHVEVASRYKQAKALIRVETSNAKLMSQLFESALVHLTESQRRLIDLVDDYDNYTLKYHDSLRMHIIHNGYNRPKVLKYIEAWHDGFRQYTEHESNAISIYKTKIANTIQSTEFYYGRLKDKVVVSFIGDACVNEVADHALKRYNADICIIIYLQSSRVSFRKSRTSCPDVDLSKWAEKLAEGGGHAYAAGGKLTDAMLTITKSFKLCI